MPLKLPDIPLATDVGHYHVMQCLGLGARGIVYLAEDRVAQRPVALKFMGCPADMDARETRARFDREAQTLSLFSHRHIVKFEGHGTVRVGTDDVQYLAMEYLPDLQPLDVAAKQHGNADWVLDRIDELLQALDYMHTHAHAVVHRDLKPGNLGIPSDGHLRVLDLGLARVEQSNLTSQGSAMGSLGYMAPEQLTDGKNVDQQADIYAVGMIMLELLGGGHPMQNLTSGRTVRAVITGKIPPTPVPLPEPLDRLARWCCALKPGDRPATAAAVLRELRGVRHRSRYGADDQNQAPTPTNEGRGGGWEASVRFLDEQLSLAREGQGNTVLVCGRSDPDRRMLLDAACKHARTMGMAVWQVDSSQQLAQWLGHATQQPAAMFTHLRSMAASRALLMCIPAMPLQDALLQSILQMGVDSGASVLLVAATETAPPVPGRLTILQLR